MKLNVGQEPCGAKRKHTMFYRGKRPKFKTNHQRSPKQNYFQMNILTDWSHLTFLSTPGKLAFISNARRQLEQCSGRKWHKIKGNGRGRVKSRELTQERLKERLHNLLEILATRTTADSDQNDRASDYSSLHTYSQAENLDIFVPDDQTSLADSVRSSHFISSIGTHSLDSSPEFFQRQISTQLDSEDNAESGADGEMCSSTPELGADQVEWNGDTGLLPALPQGLVTCEENNNNIFSYGLACSPKGQHWLLNNNNYQIDDVSSNQDPLDSSSQSISSKFSGLSLHTGPSGIDDVSENFSLSCNESRGSEKGLSLSNPGTTSGSSSQILPRCSSPQSEAISELNIDESHQGFSPPTSFQHTFLSESYSLASCFSQSSLEVIGVSQDNLADMQHTDCLDKATVEHFRWYRTSQNTELLSEEINVRHDPSPPIPQELNVSILNLSQASGTQQAFCEPQQSQNGIFRNHQSVYAESLVDRSEMEALQGSVLPDQSHEAGQQTFLLNSRNECENLNSLDESAPFLPWEAFTDFLSVADHAQLLETSYAGPTQGSTLLQICGEAQTTGPTQVENLSHLAPVYSYQGVEELEEPHLLAIDRSQDESSWNEWMPLLLPVVPLSREEQESEQVQDEDLDLSQLNLGPPSAVLLGFLVADDVDVNDTDIDLQMMRRNRHQY